MPLLSLALTLLLVPATSLANGFPQLPDTAVIEDAVIAPCPDGTMIGVIIYEATKTDKYQRSDLIFLEHDLLIGVVFFNAETDAVQSIYILQPDGSVKRHNSTEELDGHGVCWAAQEQLK